MMSETCGYTRGHGGHPSRPDRSAGTRAIGGRTAASRRPPIRRPQFDTVEDTDEQDVLLQVGERSKLGRQRHAILPVELDSSDQRGPLAQVVASCFALRILLVLPRSFELELLFGPEGEAAVLTRSQIPEVLEVEAHTRRENRPTLYIERAGKVPDELESWRQSGPSFPHSRATSSPGPHFVPLYGADPPPSTIAALCFVKA